MMGAIGYEYSSTMRDIIELPTETRLCLCYTVEWYPDTVNIKQPPLLDQCYSRGNSATNPVSTNLV
jgi:hypothetical protein